VRKLIERHTNLAKKTQAKNKEIEKKEARKLAKFIKKQEK
jgi:ribosomal protein S6